MSGLYIAGPYCFYDNGYSDWWADRKKAEGKGLQVWMPTATELKLDAGDLRLNAMEIFADLLKMREKTDIIIADLEAFRGVEPDGGTVFELGMLYGKGGRLYGRTTRLCSQREKNPNLVFGRDGVVRDEKGYPHPYLDLPFAPSIVASTRLVEGGFEDALNVCLQDLAFERMTGRKHELEIRPVEFGSCLEPVFVSSFFRYSPDRAELEKDIAGRLEKKGYLAVFPFVSEEEDPYRNAYECFEENMRRIEACSSFVADLNDFRGYEPSSDVAFECGFAFARGKKLYGFMEDTRIMRERIPSKDGKDAQGHIIENFNYPINLMFACSIESIEKADLGNFEKILG